MERRTVLLANAGLLFAPAAHAGALPPAPMAKPNAMLPPLRPTGLMIGDARVSTLDRISRYIRLG